MMAVKTKKVILFIVEGPSEETALKPVLKRIYQNEDVHFHVVHGDITSEWLVNSSNAINTVNDHIKAEMDRYGYRRGDIIRIIHLIDTDGAFIPDNNVLEGSVEKPLYEENRIITQNPQLFRERNLKKTLVLKRLYPVSNIGALPYSVYYFSRNLEHVLHNIVSDLTDDEKMDYADRFADTYQANPESFMKFVSDSEFAVQSDYRESWRFIFEGTNSLHRHCNLHLLFVKKVSTV